MGDDGQNEVEKDGEEDEEDEPEPKLLDTLGVTTIGLALCKGLTLEEVDVSKNDTPTQPKLDCYSCADELSSTARGSTDAAPESSNDAASSTDAPLAASELNSLWQPYTSSVSTQFGRPWLRCWMKVGARQHQLS